MDDSVALPPLRRPNVLWIFGDQHRAQATGYRGDANVATPNLDNLGRQGVRFDCAVAGAPWCTPFRGALLSGRYPHQTGVVANGIRLPPASPTVASAFNAAGYHTAYVGKWHLDGTNDPDHYVRRSGAAAFATGSATRPPTTSTSTTSTAPAASGPGGCAAT